MEIKIEISSIGMPYRGLIIKRFHERSRFQDTGYNEGEKVEGMVLNNWNASVITGGPLEEMLIINASLTLIYYNNRRTSPDNET